MADTITDYITRETGRFSEEIYNRVKPRSPWLGLIKRGTFPRGMGETISFLTYESQLPTVAEPTWSTMAVTDGAEGGSCLPAVEEIGSGSTTRNFTLYRRALHSHKFCAEDLRYSFSLRQQLEAMMMHFEERSLVEWEVRDRHEYFKACQRKVVIGENSLTETNTQASTWPAVEAKSILTQGVLDLYRVKLLRDGAGLSALGTANGSPQLLLITSAEMSDRLKTQSDTRTDLRESPRVSELLRPYGVEWSYKGFMHIIDHFPLRYTYNAGTYTEVPPFSSSSATTGNKSEVNSSWESATHEASFIFDPEVMHQLIPDPVTNPAPGYRFNPVNYIGQFSLRNIPHEIDNPDGNIVFFRCIMAAASKTVRPYRGVAFIHKRCDPKLNLTTSCS